MSEDQKARDEAWRAVWTEVICESLQLGARPQGTVPAAPTTTAQYAAATGRDLPRNDASAPNEDVPF